MLDTALGAGDGFETTTGTLAVDAPGVTTAGQPTMIAATSFTLAGVVATSFPLQLPWMPLVAPVTVLALYVLTTRPFMADRS